MKYERRFESLNCSLDAIDTFCTFLDASAHALSPQQHQKAIFRIAGLWTVSTATKLGDRNFIPFACELLPNQTANENSLNDPQMLVHHQLAGSTRVTGCALINKLTYRCRACHSAGPTRTGGEHQRFMLACNRAASPAHQPINERRLSVKAWAGIPAVAVSAARILLLLHR